ncbi:MAG: hypothetical protein ABSG30_12210 [Steroidobacteraceae bacterium]|jgi:hypothetical protein
MMRTAALCALHALWAALTWAALGAPVDAETGACDPQTTEVISVGVSTLCLHIEAASPARRQLLHTWVRRSAEIVTQYYGRFPAPLVFLDLGIMDGAGIGGGHTINEGGLRIHVSVGRDATSEGMTNDWVLVHEMVHLALPEIGRRHDWLAEGLAVYVEGIARAQAGNRTIPDVWAEDRHSMPLGLPRAGEGGMDQTPTWARKYWGGALFCLEAEVQIRQRTGNRQGLQAALRAILAATGGYAADRDIADVLRIGDAATGTRVLEDLYERESTTPMLTDLDALWRSLGVPQDPLTEPFDDHAPLAAIRIAITRPQGL